jgi:nucleotide-binding universal stress UspA family protein
MTMMRLMIACTGSAGAKAAIEDLGRAGLPRDAEARVLAVGEPEVVPERSATEAVTDAGVRQQGILGTKSLAPATRARDEAGGLASIVCARLVSAFPGWSVHAEDLGGPIPGWLIEAADDWGADLVVVGSEPRPRLGCLFPSDVAQRVVAEARSSVRLVRGAARRNEGAPRILIGVNDSPGTLGAVFAVAARVWPKGTEVRVVAVSGGLAQSWRARFFPESSWLGASDRDATARVPRIGQWAGGALRARGLRAMVARLAGDPGRALVDEARRWRADCIFLGARRCSEPSARGGLGSVAKAVLANAHCSVEVVRLCDVDFFAPVS